MVAGVDEAGRGPLAGPVVAAAVIFPRDLELPDIRDSKKLTEKRRLILSEQIRRKALSVGTGFVHERKIDEVNILQATYLAMRSAIGGLKPQPDFLLVDGNPADISHYPQKAIVKGDARSQSIGAASIVAKVTRDRMMRQYDRVFPEYGFAKHKGYGTRQHLDALREFGAAAIHRRSFNPVSEFRPRWEDYRSPAQIGRLGEQLAACGLIKLNCEILELNYSLPGVGEIDIIHRESDGTVVFSEVKAGLNMHRSYDPLEQIDQHKLDCLTDTATRYIEEKAIGEKVRFDVISVQFSKQKPLIKRVKGGLAIV